MAYNAYLTGYNGSNSSSYGTTSTLKWMQSVYEVNGTKFNGETQLTDLTDWYAQLTYNVGYNPFDAIDEYMPGLESGPLGNMENSDSTINFQNLTQQADYDFFLYTFSDGSNDTTFDLVDAEDSTTGQEDMQINNVPNASTTYASLAAGGLSEDEKIDFFKTLSFEMEQLKEYTLTNQEIYEIRDEITNLSTVVLQQQMDKIANIQAEFEAILAEYAVTPVTGEKDGVDLSTMKDDFYDADTLNAYTGAMAADNTTIFSGTEADRSDSVLFEYFVAKRSNDSLTFDGFLLDKFPDWKTDETIADENTSTGFKATDFENIEEGEDKLDMIDLFTEHYIFDEMLAAFKDYEDAYNRLYSLQMSLEVASQYSAEFEYRKDLAAEVYANMSLDSQQSMINHQSLITGMTRGNNYGPSLYKEIGDYVPEFVGFYGNTSSDDVNTTGYSTKSGGLVDPYEFTLNGVDYIMGVDKDGDGAISDASEILGITDAFENPFESLVGLDNNQDGFVSQDELQAGGIIFNAVSNQGKLSGGTLDSDLIRGIDLYSLKKADDPDGKLAGTFEVQTANGTTVQAKQTFEDQAYFNRLFGTIVDLRPYQGASAEVAEVAQDVEIEEEVTESQTTSSTSSTTSSYYDKLMKELDGVYGNISSETSAEGTLEQVCWETGTILTPAQRVTILESIENSTSSQDIESLIRNEIESLNLSA